MTSTNQGTGGYSGYFNNAPNFYTGQQQAAGNEGNWGNTYLGSYYNNPLKTMFGPGGGGIQGLANQWGIGGLNYPDINNPNTAPTINKWMSNLNGGLNSSLDQYSKQLANAGVTASRGGMGVQGGADPYAAMRQQQMGTIANQYGQNFDKSVNYMANAANFNRGLFGDALGALGNMYSTDVNAGVNLLGLQNNALQQNAGNQLSWEQMKQNAWNKDVDWRNYQTNQKNEWARDDTVWGRTAAERQQALDKGALDIQNQQRQMYQNQADWQTGNRQKTIIGDAYNKALNDYTRGDMTWGQGTWFPNNAKTFMDVGLMNKLGGGGGGYAGNPTGRYSPQLQRTYAPSANYGGW